MYSSTKIIELGSCAFRQPQADSHCRFLHGYRLTAKFWFSAKHLDQNNWVVDFGGLKGLKKLMQNQFDHTTCISRTDPKLDVFRKLNEAGVCDLRVMDGVGIEKFAEWCHVVADNYVDELTDGRCNCVKVEVFEHESNSAIFEMWNSSTSGALYMNDKADEIEKSVNQMKRSRTEPLPFSGKAKEVKSTEPEPKKDLTKPPFRGARVNTNKTKTTNKWIDPESDNTWGV
jgi:6-pyruvoyltetrahydropterin/6-carboxytetrahydropterin synthase